MTTSNEQSPPPPPPAVRVVKRYSNRKLYDTVDSKYVTLPQIAEIVRRGEEVQIIDNNSKEDLTRVTLAQILLEEERKQAQARTLPLTALKDLLHTSGERIMTSLREGPVGKLIGGREGVPERVGDRAGDPPSSPSTAPPAPPPPPAATPAPVVAAPAPQPSPAPLDAAATPQRESRRMQQLVEQSREAIDQWQHRVDDRMRTFWESINPTAQIVALQAEVRRLSQRVDELEARCQALEGTRGPREDDWE